MAASAFVAVCCAHELPARADNSHPDGLSGIFSDVRAAGENDLTFFADCGRRTLRGFFLHCGAEQRGRCLLFCGIYGKISLSYPKIL